MMATNVQMSSKIATYTLIGCLDMKGDQRVQVTCLLHNLLTCFFRLMSKYDDVTLEQIPPTLGPGKKEHIMLPQDKCNVSTNDNCVHAWLTKDQQPLKRKGNGRGVHISDWICEPSCRLVLSPEQVAVQMLLPEAE